MSVLKIKNLYAKIENKAILNGVNLEIKSGEVHALMGPNGSGKSTLANVLVGSPSISFVSGDVFLDKKNILEMTVDQRSISGMFLGFQNPVAVSGVSVLSLLRIIKNNQEKQNQKSHIETQNLIKEISKKLAVLGLNKDFIDRYVNDGFSGGEKKKLEILQMLFLEPKFAVLDEIDSGIDIDSLKIIGEIISKMVTKKKMGLLVITHNPRLLNYIKPNFVHIFKDGQIVKTGGKNVLKCLEVNGFKKIKQ